MPPRCFLALTLPAAGTRALVSARETFVTRDPAWSGEKWVAPGNLHVTVAFLGALDDDRLGDGVARLLAAAAAQPAFEAFLVGVVAVPSLRQATMLWATLGGAADRLEALRESACVAFPEAGCDLDRPLRPHVTLVRARDRRPVDAGAVAAASDLVAAAGKRPEGIVSVRFATLFSSTLTPLGPMYREIAVAHLAR